MPENDSKPLSRPDPVAYDIPETHLSAFFDEALRDSLHRFHGKLTAPFQEVLRSARQQQLRVRGDEAERKRLIRVVLEGLFESLSEVASSELIAKAAALWQEEVEPAVEALPEQLVCVQGDERFQATTGDSAYIRSAKAIKRVAYATAKQFWTFRNQKTEPVPDYHFHQSVPLRRIGRYVLLAQETVFRDTVAFACCELTRIFATLLLDEQHVDESESSQSKGNTPASAVREAETASAQNEGDKAAPPKTDSTSSSSKKDFAFFLKMPAAAQAERITAALNRLEALCGLTTENHPVLRALPDKAIGLARKAGTIELPESRFGSHRVQQQRAAAAKAAAANSAKWQLCFATVIADYGVQLSLSGLEKEMNQLGEKLRELTHAFFRDNCYVPAEKSISLLRAQRELLDEELSRPKLKSRIEQVQLEAKEAFESGIPQEAAQHEVLEKLTGQIRQLITEASLYVQRFGEELVLAESRSLRFPEPLIKTDRLKWRALSTRFLQSKAFRPLDPAAQQLGPFLDKQRLAMEEAAGIAETNLQAAVYAITEKGEADPAEIAQTGLQRAINALESSIVAIREKQDSYEQLVKKGSSSVLRRLEQLMRDRDYSALELQDKAILVQEGALNWQERAQRFAARAGDTFAIAFRYARMKFAGYYAPVARFLGFEPVHAESARERLNLTEYLIRNKSNDEKLPFIYQRLFRRSLLIEQRFYLDAPGNIGHLVTGYEQWRKGIPWSMAVVGQKGSGKSTLIHFFKQSERLKTQVVHIDLSETIYEPGPMLRLISRAAGFSETDSLGELVAKFERSSIRRVIVFEGVQNLYLRNINGYGAISQFWELLSLTSSQVFWVAACSRDAWFFFSRMFSAEQFFSQVLHVDRLSGRDIQQGIMLRHRATGFDAAFLPSPEITKSRAYRKLLGDKKALQQYLQDQYFESLAEMADGNFSVAMIFWVNSISKADASTITLSPIEVADIDALESPSREVQFTLAALIRHDVLTPEQLALALHQPLSGARLMLGRLAAKGLVVKVSQGYTINHLVYRQVTRLLAGKNILH
ncbi:hypothetical protein CYPRO_0364 [Cyclonatronum proteinivorum]|uniref:AAA domain-containing protein n=1 Tax=Cyclonatronum proteinivorum TaxID=1457365 RepID=A0A345UGQ0_9BACT|nr:hypothetical protein [Cyclonatronum proteinivorum]AXI99651.1 hypothetical protein CYPRO_0364 [Cyclonatronum proteinivorum]